MRALTIRIPSDENKLIYLFLFSLPLFLNGIGLTFVSPVYTTLPLTILAPLFCIIKNDKLDTVAYFVMVFQLYCLALISFQAAAFGLDSSIVNEIVRIAFPPIFFLIGYLIFRDKTREQLLKYLVFFVKVSVATLALEGFVRLFILTSVWEIFFKSYYAFKEDSPLYPDSNFVGFNLLILFGICLYTRVYHKLRIFKYDLAFIFILIFFTFSRAAIISSGMIWVYYLWRRGGVKTKAFMLFSGVTGTAVVFGAILADGSFQTKLGIMEFFIEWLNFPLDQILFGIGSGNMKSVFNWDSHNLFGLTIELGIIWILAISVLYIVFFYYSNGRLIWILGPTFLCSLISLFPITYTSMFYVGISFIYLLEKGERFVLFNKEITI